MNKRVRRVLNILKPKVKAFGFNKKELQSVAAKIADNLTSADDAPEEDVNAEIEKEIEAVLPILELGRSYANRVINDNRNDDEDNNDDDNDDDDDESKSRQLSNKSSKTKSNTKSDEMPAWAKAIIESNNSLKAELAGIKGERVTDTRRGKLEKLLKDTGTFGTRTLKSFAKMKFENDDDFDDFYSEVEDDLKALNQERANAGLANLGAPATGTNNKKESKDEVLSDDDIKALASI